MTDSRKEYFERSQDHSFAELSLSENLLVVRRGLIGKPCLVINVAPDYRDLPLGAEMAKKELLGKGYKPVGSASPVVDGSSAELVWDDSLSDTSDNKRLIELATNWHSQEVCNIVRFSDGLDFDGDLDVEWMVDSGLATGLLIDGAVQVNGRFSQDTYCYPNGILVNGNVTAKNFIQADSHMKVNGDLHIDQTVYGYYNDGTLNINGTVYAEAFVSDDHDMGAEHWRCFTKLIDGLEDASWVDPYLLDEDLQLDFEKVKQYVKSGKSLLREGVVYSHTE